MGNCILTVSIFQKMHLIFKRKKNTIAYIVKKNPCKQLQNYNGGEIMDHNPENHINSKKRTSTYICSENQDEELAKKKKLQRWAVLLS